MKLRYIIGCAGLLLSAAAADANDGVAWDSLDESQQQVLAEYADAWDSLPPATRRQFLNLFDKIRRVFHK